MSAETAPKGQPVDAALPIQIEEIGILRLLMEEAFVSGRSYASAGLSPAAGSRWIRARVQRLVDQAPSVFGSAGQYRSAGLGTLQAAFDLGHRDYEMQPRIPPSKDRIGAAVDDLMSGFFLACMLEQAGDVDEKDILDPPELRAEPIFNVITDQGLHRIRSEFFRDQDGMLYQIIVVRDGTEVTVYRRYCGSTKPVPVFGGYTETEINFLALAFAEIKAARQERSI